DVRPLLDEFDALLERHPSPLLMPSPSGGDRRFDGWRIGRRNQTQHVIPVGGVAPLRDRLVRARDPATIDARHGERFRPCRTRLVVGSRRSDVEVLQEIRQFEIAYAAIDQEIACGTGVEGVVRSDRVFDNGDVVTMRERVENRLTYTRVRVGPADEEW